MGRSISPRPSPDHSTSSNGSSRDVVAPPPSATATAPAGSSSSSGPSTRNFKATQAASIAAVVDSTSAHRDMMPGLAELMGGSSVGVLNVPLFKSGGGGGGSSEVAQSRIMNATGGDGDKDGSGVDSEAAAAGHPSLPSIDAVCTAASRLINECPPFMTMSFRDSAPQLTLEDPPSVNKKGNGNGKPGDKSASSNVNFQRKFVVKGGMKGYRMSRATHGVTSGCYYYEAVILGSVNGDTSTSSKERGVKRPLNEMKGQSKENNADSSAENGLKEKSGSTNGHFRIGWSTRLADLQAPVGYNEHSYGVRDTMGSRIHKSRREDKWGGIGFGPGDVLGVAICLVEKKTTTTSSTSSSTPLASASNNKNESGQNGSSSANGGATSSTLTNHIRFFKNGQPMGKQNFIAFDNINPGTYHPSISCYMDGTSQLNFGPHFVYPPQGVPSDINLRPISELCISPPPPEDAVEKVMSGGSKEGKKIFFSKRTDDGIVSAFKKLVKLETEMRYEAYSKHLDLHRREISAFRKERGLGTSDLV